eukprot:3878071-Rhodomonas_salina.2
MLRHARHAGQYCAWGEINAIIVHDRYHLSRKTLPFSRKAFVFAAAAPPPPPYAYRITLRVAR